MTETLASRTGTALSWQAIQFVGVKVIYFVRLFVLARMLTPDDFGLFGVSVVAMDFLLALTNPGMQQALVQSHDPKGRDYHAAYTVGLVRALVVSAPLVFVAPWIAEFVAEPRAVLLIQVMALRPLIQAGASIRVAELVRNLSFNRLAAIQLGEAILNTGTAVVLAVPLGVWALVWGPLAGAFGSLIVSYVVAPYRPKLTLAGSAMRPLVIYGRWVFLAGILGVGANVVIRVVVTRELGAAELGLYFLAGKLAFLAWDASNALVEKVAFPLYARLQDQHSEAQRTFRFFLTLVGAFLIPASCVLIVVAPGLVEHLLGPRWERTVPLIRILAAVPVVGLVGSAISPLLLGFGRPRAVALLELIQFSVVVVGLFLLLGPFGIIGAAFAFLASVAASQLVGVAQLITSLRSPFTGVGHRFILIGTATIASATLAWVLEEVLPGAIGVIVGVTGAALLVIPVLILGDRRFNLGIAGDLARFFPGLASRAGRILRVS